MEVRIVKPPGPPLLFVPLVNPQPESEMSRSVANSNRQAGREPFVTALLASIRAEESSLMPFILFVLPLILTTPGLIVASVLRLMVQRREGQKHLL